MTDRSPDPDDDHAWLLARERGEPAPPISEARARQYAQLNRLIANLPAVPAGTAQRAGWEQAVLEAIDATAAESADPGTPAATIRTPRPSQPTATTGHRRRTAAAVAAGFAMVASVAIVILMQREHPQDVRVGPSVPGNPQPSGSPEQVPEVTRGIHVEHGRLAFDLAVQVRRSDTAVPHELRDGDTVKAGDGLRASIRTSADAYLYLAYCKDQHLELYPSQRGVRTRAGDLVVVPEGGRELIIDGNPGSEVLYLLLSRDELALADPGLAELVAAIGGANKAIDCGASLDSRLTKPSGVSPPTNVLRGARISGGEVAADSDGIAIVRYRFVHAPD